MKKASEKDIKEFFEAVQAGDLEKVTFFLKEDPGLAEINNKNGETPLQLAALKGHTEIAKLLLDIYPDAAKIQNEVGEGETPLHYAACREDRGHTEVAKLLLDIYPDAAKIKDKDGDTPLHWAASRGHTKLAKLLLDTYPAAAKIEGYERRTPLHWAAFYGDTEFAKALLDIYPDAAKIKDEDGDTPLHRAAYRGHTAVAKLLLDKLNISELEELKKTSRNTPSHETAKSMIKKEIDRKEIKAVKKAMNVPDLEF
jgi:ankyrin repeat protein